MVVLTLLGMVLSSRPLLHVNGTLVGAVVDDKTTYILMPYYLYDKIPLLDAGRTPGRFGTLTMFGVSILAGFGFRDFIRLFRKLWLRYVVIFLMVVVLPWTI